MLFTALTSNLDIISIYSILFPASQLSTSTILRIEKKYMHF